MFSKFPMASDMPTKPDCPKALKLKKDSPYAMAAYGGLPKQTDVSKFMEVLEGKKDGKGLTDKVPGMLVHGSGGKGDEKRYEIKSFDDSSSLEIVTLKPDESLDGTTS